jgi:hypothetical protein
VFYSKTQDICKKIYNKKGNTLRAIERQHFFNEPLHVTPKREIPKLVHQIWFGKTLDSKAVRYHLIKGAREAAEKNGFSYKLWSNDDLTVEHFPITWEYMQTAKEVGEELEQSRFAQIADLARYEILQRFGGIYLDSLFEVSDQFFKYIEDHKYFEIIVANEDPCGLKCKGKAGHYISNGFFACVPGCIVLKRLIHPETLDEIDFYNVLTTNGGSSSTNDANSAIGNHHRISKAKNKTMATVTKLSIGIARLDAASYRAIMHSMKNQLSVEFKSQTPLFISPTCLNNILGVLKTPLSRLPSIPSSHPSFLLPFWIQT